MWNLKASIAALKSSVVVNALAESVRGLSTRKKPARFGKALTAFRQSRWCRLGTGDDAHKTRVAVVRRHPVTFSLPAITAFIGIDWHLTDRL